MLSCRNLFTCLIVGFTLTFCGQTFASEPVTFTDANLEAAVRDKLGIPSNPIYDTDMASMTGTLNMYYLGIANLVGMEYATNLEELRLRDNSVSDLTPISGLTAHLTVIDVAYNNVSNISPVAGLVNLTSLNLDSNGVSNIAPVAGLTNLEMLYLDDNGISNIGPVAGLTSLHSLFLNDNNLTDISAVQNLTNLATLDVNNNNLTNISPVVNLTSMTHLEMNSNSISDISPLAGMTLVSSLFLDNNNISDISTLSELSSLISLHLEDNQIEDIAPLAGLTNLRYLYLKNNQIQTIRLSGADLPLLQGFDVTNNSVKTVLLDRATMNQTVFESLMNGRSSTRKGIAELTSVLTLDMSRVDFADVSDFSSMYTMDHVETLSFVNAANLDGSDVVTLTGQLYALDWLNVAGVWDTFDTAEQNALLAWDAGVGNSLVTLFGDANGDGTVDGSDATILANYWQVGVNDGQTANWSMGDFNGDGQVDGSDATLLASHWQESNTTTATTVPEPAALTMLLTLAGLAMLWKKRKGKSKLLFIEQ